MGKIITCLRFDVRSLELENPVHVHVNEPVNENNPGTGTFTGLIGSSVEIYWGLGVKG